jgi:hypothetical protein
MAPITSFGSLDEIRRKVVSELVDLDLSIGRKRSRRYWLARRLRRSVGRVLRIVR